MSGGVSGAEGVGRSDGPSAGGCGSTDGGEASWLVGGSAAGGEASSVVVGSTAGVGVSDGGSGDGVNSVRRDV